ncbi:MAG: DNRLRE domain-containing protein [Thermoproteota archaeon]
MNRTSITLGFLTILIICSATPCVVTRIAGDDVPLYTRQFSPTGDALVAGGTYSGNNYGSLTRIGVSAGSSESQVWRSFIKFDLNTIPPGSVIVSANLMLFMYQAPVSIRTLVCNLVNADGWDEGTITWNNQPPATVSVSSATVGTTSNVWLSVDVKSSVEKFASKDVAGAMPNFGWRLKDSTESAAIQTYCYMYSKEHSDSSKRPYLEVKYYPPHLELSLANSSIQAGNWVKMTVTRKTYNGEPVTRGDLKVKLSSTSTSVNRKFSLTKGGSAITELTISESDGNSKEFWYYDDKVGTWDIHIWTDDYMYITWSGGFIIFVPNYGDDIKQLTVKPGPLDRFTFDTISSPKQVAVPFSITITAYDEYGNVKTDYTGTNSLLDTTGTIEPKLTGAFVNGRWTGMVTISRIGDNVKITTSGAGKSGESNPFNVKAGPPEKLALTPPSFTMAAGVTYSHLNISIKDANGYETVSSTPIIVSLSTTSPEGEFRQSGTASRITSIIIPAGSSMVKVDYYDVKGGTWILTASAAGLTLSTATVTVIPDTKPPVTTINYDPKHSSDATTYVSGSTLFKLSATDDASGVKQTKYRIDGGSWNTYTAGFTLSTLSDGPHTIGYYSTDKADNNEAEKTLTVVLDKTPPAISGASPTGSIVMGSTSIKFTVRVEDSGSGVKEVRLTVDGIPQGTMTGGSDYSKTITLTEGSHNWSVEAIDNLDNAASWNGVFTLTVDTAPPTVSGLTAPSNPVFGEHTVITCQVSDLLSGVKDVSLYYSIDGGSSWTRVTMVLQEGGYTGSIPSQMFFKEVQYYVEAVDNVGNETRTPVSKYTVGIPIWLYATLLALILVIIAILLLRRRKPSYVQPLPPPPPPPPC